MTPIWQTERTIRVKLDKFEVKAPSLIPAGISVVLSVWGVKVGRTGSRAPEVWRRGERRRPRSSMAVPAGLGPDLIWRVYMTRNYLQQDSFSAGVCRVTSCWLPSSGLTGQWETYLDNHLPDTWCVMTMPWHVIRQYHSLAFRGQGQ